MKKNCNPKKKLIEFLHNIGKRNYDIHQQDPYLPHKGSNPLVQHLHTVSVDLRSESLSSQTLTEVSYFPNEGVFNLKKVLVFNLKAAC